MKPQKTVNSQSNPKKEECNGRYHISLCQAILLNYHKQNSMVKTDANQWNRIRYLEINTASKIN